MRLRARLRINAGENTGTHGAGIAQATGQRPSVDTADADNLLLVEIVVEAPLGTKVGDHPRRIANYEASNPELRGFEIFVIHSGDPDVRRRHHDDLARVAGVAQRLLVAGHSGGEYSLADRGSAGAVGVAGVASAVFEDEHCSFVAFHRGSIRVCHWRCFLLGKS